MELSSLPMIELHLHLDGAIPPETMWDLANAQGLPLPAVTLDDFRRWLARTSDCADVNTYLARFELPLQLMQTEESIVRVTRDVLSVLARQGHIYDEVRFAPQLHKRAGLTQRQAVEAVLEGLLPEQTTTQMPDRRNRQLRQPPMFPISREVCDALPLPALLL